tara:strand:+ start:489 stop:608 length:120 start_codon:yes stop_codon:yes gene_type:complete
MPRFGKGLKTVSSQTMTGGRKKDVRQKRVRQEVKKQQKK